MKKLLIITYYWPPSGGAGVQRWLKFTKYLPEFGWQPVVLTVSPEDASYPQIDESLAAEVSPEVNVFRTPSFELYQLYKWFSGKKEVPYGGFANESRESAGQKLSKFVRGNLLLPDPRRGWNRYALKKAAALIRESQIDTIVTTSPPHSTQLIGLELKKRFNVRWIADLRDPWTDIYYYNQFRHTALALRIDRNYERQVIEKADQLITVSEDVKRLLAAKSKQPVADKIHVIPNGYDDEDFANPLPPDDAKITLTYTGTISESYDITGLIEALSGLDEKQRTQLKLRFVGKIPGTIVGKIRQTVPDIDLDLVGYVDHAKSIEYLFRSHLLLLVVPKVPNNRGIITGKFFEYLASGRPVLAIGPTDGDLADLIAETRCGQLFDYADAAGMQELIEKCANRQFAVNSADKAQRYSRRNLSQELAKMLEQ
jgi:glycosyltransferase involved in cell wall biosynthesis